MRQKQTVCSCGWKLSGDKNYVNPRHGLCEFNDHGLACGQAGSIALHTGEGGPWYCGKHALGIKGMGTKKGTMSIKQYLASMQEENSEAKLEREAIQAEST
jgi:hypothetical protein